MKSALPSAMCRAVHTALCGKRRGPRNPCAITAGLLIAWPCAQSHLAAPLPQERATQPRSPEAKAEGFPSFLVSLAAHGNANVPTRARPCRGCHADSSAQSQGVTGKGLGFSTPFLLN